jgi:hypothetical protein
LVLLTTGNLTTLAAAHLALGRHTEAFAHSREALRILDECGGEGPDSPQRDYWMCYLVLQPLGETVLAHRALESAYHLLMERAQRISDTNMRVSFLEQVSFNHSIMQASNQLALF